MESNSNLLNDLTSFCKKYKVYFSKEVIQIGRKVFLKDDRFTIDEDTVHAGFLIGQYTNKFKPSPAFLDEFFNSAPCVKVDKKRAWLFLCGRDLFNENVENLSRSPNVIVKDYDDNILGLATVHNNIIKNVMDKGIYLRREMR